MKPIVVRGGGDLATGVIHRLSKSGYSVIVLETDKPSAIRRLVAFSEAVEKGSACVEGITCVCVNSVKRHLKRQNLCIRCFWLTRKEKVFLY